VKSSLLPITAKQVGYERLMVTERPKFEQICFCDNRRLEKSFNSEDTSSKWQHHTDYHFQTGSRKRNCHYNHTT